MELIYVVYHSLHLQTHIIIVCALAIVYMFVMGVRMGGGSAAKRQNLCASVFGSSRLSVSTLTLTLSLSH